MTGGCGWSLAVFDLQVEGAVDYDVLDANQRGTTMPGCTDSHAANYDAAAAQTDASCVYEICVTLAGGGAPDGGTQCDLVASGVDQAPAIIARADGGSVRLVIQGRHQAAPDQVSYELARLETQLELTDEQRLELRMVRVEGRETFGGGGSGFGTGLSLQAASTCHAEHIEFVGNTQRGVFFYLLFCDALPL